VNVLVIPCKFVFSRHVELWRGVWEPEAEDAIGFFHQLLPTLCLNKVLSCSIRNRNVIIHREISKIRLQNLVLAGSESLVFVEFLKAWSSLLEDDGSATPLAPHFSQCALCFDMI
jgi:hypothetical protein